MKRDILDRDPVFTAQFRRLLSDNGVKPLRLPARSPNLNAYAELQCTTCREMGYKDRSALV